MYTECTADCYNSKIFETLKKFVSDIVCSLKFSEPHPPLFPVCGNE